MKVKEIKGYEASDGKIFKHKDAAQKYQDITLRNDRLEQWIRSNINGLRGSSSPTEIVRKAIKENADSLLLALTGDKDQLEQIQEK